MCQIILKFKRKTIGNVHNLKAQMWPPQSCLCRAHEGVRSKTKSRESTSQPLFGDCGHVLSRCGFCLSASWPWGTSAWPGTLAWSTAHTCLSTPQTRRAAAPPALRPAPPTTAPGTSARRTGSRPPSPASRPRSVWACHSLLFPAPALWQVQPVVSLEMTL